MGELNPFQAPKVSAAAAEDVVGKKQAAAGVRRALLETEGGILGEEVDEVRRRENLLGN